MKVKVQINTRSRKDNKAGIVSGTFCDLPPSVERVIATDPAILPALLVFTAQVAKCALASADRDFISSELILSTEPA